VKKEVDISLDKYISIFPKYEGKKDEGNRERKSGRGGRKRKSSIFNLKIFL
jgi:hypothetical protein